MNKTLIPAVPVVLFSLACAPTSFAEGPASPASAGDFRYQKALTANTKVEVRDLNGAIRVEPTSGDLLEIVAIKSGSPEDVKRVQVIAREEGGTIIACALWPGQDASTCRPGAWPSGAKDDNEARVRVEFRLRVPSRVIAIQAHTMNGEIVAQSPAGEVNLHTMNGAIDVTAKGPITAETMNGSVVAHAAPGNAVQLTTKNGRVEVSLAANANADVQASTTNGRVRSEFGEVPAPAIPRLHDVKLRLGAGGTAISLRTLNGDVLLRREGA